MKKLIIFLVSIYACTINLPGQSPVWPLGPNPHNYSTNVSDAVPSEVVSWLGMVNNPTNTQIPGGPLNVAHGNAIGGFDCCGNMVFYAIHSGSFNNNELWIRNSSGEVILKDGNNVNLGLNAVKSDPEIQVVRVPTKCNEWYIIYLENDASLSNVKNTYNTKRLLYSQIRFNVITGLMNVVLSNNGSPIYNIPLSISSGVIPEYQHGKACRDNCLYAIRRKQEYPYKIPSYTDPRIDKFNITPSGIVYAFSSGIFNLDYYSLSPPGSPLELNNDGTELAFLNLDENVDRNNLYTFSVSPTMILLNRTINTNKLKIKPHDNTIGLPGNYFSTATSYTDINYSNSNLISIDQFNQTNNTFLNLSFLKNFGKKLSAIQYSPDGKLIYILGGGYIGSPNYNYLSYLAQIDLSTYNNTDQNANAALKIQTAVGLSAISVDDGIGAYFLNAQDPNYYNSHSLRRIQSAVDNNLYFTKNGTNKLFVLPDPNIPWSASDLYAKEVDLSTVSPNVPNINTINDVMLLPDHIDGYNYISSNTNILINNPYASICKGAPSFTLTATPSGGIWSGSSLISNTGVFNPSTIGSYILTYSLIDSINGCSKSTTIDVIDCPLSCCEQVFLNTSIKDTACCGGFTAKCDIKSFKVTVVNGTIMTANWNCNSTIPAGYVNQSNFSFTPPGGCSILLFDVCVTSNKTPALPITITYDIIFADETTCKKSEVKYCKPASTDCCAKITFKPGTLFPEQSLKYQIFTIQNLYTASPICKVTMSHSPGISFYTSGLKIDNVSSTAAWNGNMIPLTGAISAVNSIEFKLYANLTYVGVTTITVEKCDGTKCTFNINWKGKKTIQDAVLFTTDVINLETGYQLSAYQMSLKAKANGTVPVKYVAIGFADKSQVATDKPEFFAISGSMHPSDTFPSYLEPTNASMMGKHNVLFELENPLLLKNGENSKLFNVVMKLLKGKTTKLGFTLFDAEGEIINSNEYEITNFATDVNTKTIDINENNEPDIFELFDVYPNPAQNEVNIKYVLGRERNVNMELYDAQGKLIQVVEKGIKQAGIHEVKLNISSLPSGTYVIKIISGNEISSLQFVVTK